MLLWAMILGVIILILYWVIRGGYFDSYFSDEPGFRPIQVGEGVTWRARTDSGVYQIAEKGIYPMPNDKMLVHFIGLKEPVVFDSDEVHVTVGAVTGLDYFYFTRDPFGNVSNQGLSHLAPVHGKQVVKRAAETDAVREHIEEHSITVEATKSVQEVEQHQKTDELFKSATNQGALSALRAMLKKTAKKAKVGVESDGADENTADADSD